MNLRSFMFCILLITTTVIYQNAVLACTRNIVSISSFAPAHVDFTTNDTVTVNFNVTHAAPTTNCLVTIVAEYGNATTFTDRFMQISAVDTINFNIHKNLPATAANIIRDQEDTTSTLQLIFPPIFTTAGGATTNTTSFVAVKVDTSALTLEPGLYTEAIVFKLLAEPIPLTTPFINFDVVDERAIAFNFLVPSEIQVAIVNTSASFNSLATSYFMNFGELESGEVQAADVMVRTNVGYNLRVSSLNDGNLVNLDSPSSQIPYTFTANGTTVSLVGSSGSPVLISSNALPHVGDGYRIPITSTISTFSNQVVGAYQDTISFEVEAF